jgi:hypothetical protein
VDKEEIRWFKSVALRFRCIYIIVKVAAAAQRYSSYFIPIKSGLKMMESFTPFNSFDVHVVLNEPSDQPVAI